jgi:hypothetical protein
MGEKESHTLDTFMLKGRIIKEDFRERMISSAEARMIKGGNGLAFLVGYKTHSSLFCLLNSLY